MVFCMRNYNIPIKNMTIHKIDVYLNSLKDAPEHQKMCAYIERLAQMQQAFMEIIPPQLAQPCSLGRLSDGKLTILVSNGAIAAKLKQILPSLLSNFQKKGYVEITAIQITVQANYYTYREEKSSHKKPEIGQNGIKRLSKFATNLPASPLKKAIKTMLKSRTNSFR